jgi:hypothetical protein
MKKMLKIRSLLFGITVLFALMLQSAHSFHHLEDFLTEKHCNHKYSNNKADISHAHSNFEHCFVCEFTFSNSIKSDFFTFKYNKSIHSVSYFHFFTKEIVNHFKGSLFALRAPPICIV